MDLETAKRVCSDLVKGSRQINELRSEIDLIVSVIIASISRSSFNETPVTVNLNPGSQGLRWIITSKCGRFKLVVGLALGSQVPPPLQILYISTEGANGIPLAYVKKIREELPKLLSWVLAQDREFILGKRVTLLLDAAKGPEV